MSAPFRALASALGGKANEELRSVGFEAGRADLAPPMRERLQKVAKALQARPQLKLVVHGAYAPEADARALREATVRESIALALGVERSKGEVADPVAFDDPQTQRVLERLLQARQGEGAMEKFVEGYVDTTGKQAHRVDSPEPTGGERGASSTTSPPPIGPGLSGAAQLLYRGQARHHTGQRVIADSTSGAAATRRSLGKLHAIELCRVIVEESSPIGMRKAFRHPFEVVEHHPEGHP